MLSYIVAICLLQSTTAFVPRSLWKATFSRSLIVSSSSAVPSQLWAVKQDLFSDDLFDDDDESKEKKVKSTKEEGSSKKYLDEKWELNKEDAKDFKGFTKEKAPSGPVEDVPSFALMYKIRREYLDTSIDAIMGEHNGYCLKFKRLLNSELIDMGKAKGVVLLWAGLSGADRDDTKAEIMSFLEEDPLISKDVVENWDLIELSKKGESVELPPLSVAR